MHSLFLEKFIDKYNDFIQFQYTHYFILSVELSVCLYACLSVCLPVPSLSGCVSGYVWDELRCISDRTSITRFMAQWVGMTANHLKMCCFFCPAQSSKWWLLFESWLPFLQKSVKRSFALIFCLILSSLSSSISLPPLLLAYGSTQLSLPHSERLVTLSRHYQQNRIYETLLSGRNSVCSAGLNVVSTRWSQNKWHYNVQAKNKLMNKANQKKKKA